MFFYSFPIFSQDSLWVVVDKIVLSGNVKTKPEIILREVSLATGDSLPAEDLQRFIANTEFRIFNTGLFVTVQCRLDTTIRDRSTLMISLKERWYTYIIPLIDLADRNFNEWWQQRGRDPGRINYGFYFVQKNTRGRNETLKLKLQGGFTGKAELSYFIPYIHKKRKSGLNIGLSYIYSRALAYTLEDHRLIYHEGGHAQIYRYAANTEYIYRDRFYSWHKIKGSFHHQQVSDSIARLNPDYFLYGKKARTYGILSYTFLMDRRDVQYYALRGYFLSLEVEKKGLFHARGVNVLSFNPDLGFYSPLYRERLFYAGGLSAKISFPGKQAFYDLRGLGYENNFVRGYELYVINGQHSALWRNSVKLKLFNQTRRTHGLNIAQFSTLPITLFLTGNIDLGYVYAPVRLPGNDRLSDQLLMGAGLGLDLVTFYDIVIRTEYSVNRMGQGGLYFHFMSAIGGQKIL